MHRPDLFQTNKTELKSDKNLERRSISCELWTECPNWVLIRLKNDSTAKYACLGRSSVCQQYMYITAY